MFRRRSDDLKARWHRKATVQLRHDSREPLHAAQETSPRSSTSFFVEKSLSAFSQSSQQLSTVTHKTYKRNENFARSGRKYLCCISSSAQPECDYLTAFFEELWPVALPKERKIRPDPILGAALYILLHHL
jgi:hypothetical protein